MRHGIMVTVQLGDLRMPPHSCSFLVVGATRAPRTRKETTMSTNKTAPATTPATVTIPAAARKSWLAAETGADRAEVKALAYRSRMAALVLSLAYKAGTPKLVSATWAALGEERFGVPASELSSTWRLVMSHTIGALKARGEVNVETTEALYRELDALIKAGELDEAKARVRREYIAAGKARAANKGKGTDAESTDATSTDAESTDATSTDAESTDATSTDAESTDAATVNPDTSADKVMARLIRDAQLLADLTKAGQMIDIDAWKLLNAALTKAGRTSHLLRTAGDKATAR